MDMREGVDMHKHILYVTLFNDFTISYNNIMFKKNQIKSKKLFKLLAYLLYYHHRFVSSEELIEILWEEDEVNNPILALKNLVYRLRTLLKNQLDLQDFIITGESGYFIGESYTIMSDVDLFEDYSQQINQDHQSMELYKKCLELYTGHFLPELSDYQILSLNTYYHSLYLSRVLECAHLLKEDNQYAGMEDLAKSAIAIDNLNESLYEILIKSQYCQHKYREAMETYRSTTDLLYQTLGVQPSQSMRELYEIIKQESHAESHITDIQNELTQNQGEGAYFCEYGTFKDIYSMQARMIDRLGICDHLCLMTVKSLSNNDNLENETMTKVMLKIQKALTHKLRIGDIISRYSYNQFIILLPACNYENANMVMKRVLKGMKSTIQYNHVSIDLSIEEVGLKDL